MHARILALVFALTLSSFAQTPSQKHPFTFEDMMKLKRVGAPQPSLDGKWVVFDCEDIDLRERSGSCRTAIKSNAKSRGATTVFTRRQTLDLDIESNRSDANLDVRFRS
jgi:hypothetical protein